MIRIADNSLGIIEERCQKLFDPFFTTKQVGSGTGLGLAICYQVIVEKSKGQLLVNSESGNDA
ncbi:MAG: ATP-binding protein [Coleofasciculaceae cyanobacterium]